MTNFFLNPELRYERLSIDRIEEELKRISSMKVTEEEKEQEFTNYLKQKFLLIEKHYTIANKYFRENSYEKAINEYNLTQNLIEDLLKNNSRKSFKNNQHQLFDDIYTNRQKYSNPEISYIKRFDKLLELSVKTIGMLHTNLNFDPLESETIKKPIRSVTDLQKLAKTDNPTKSAKEALLLKQSEIIKKMPHIFEKDKTAEDTDSTNDLLKETVQRELIFKFDSHNIIFQFYDSSFQDNIKVLRDAYTRRNKEDIQYAFQDVDSFILQLPHIASFIIPLSLGTCYFNLGDYQNAIKQFTGCSNYPYLSERYETKTLWLKIAKSYYALGDRYFSTGELKRALDCYSIIVPLDTNISSFLFNNPNLRLVGEEVKNTLAHHGETQIKHVFDEEIASLVLATQAQLKKIKNNFDILGNSKEDLPVFSFRHLSGLAQHYVQQYIYAQKQYFAYREAKTNNTLSYQHLNQILSLNRDILSIYNKQKQLVGEELNIYENTYKFSLDSLNNIEDLLVQYRKYLSNRDGKNVSSRNISFLATNNKKRSPASRDNLLDRSLTLKIVSGRYEIASLENQLTELSEGAKIAQDQMMRRQVKLELLDQYINIATIQLSCLENGSTSFNPQQFNSQAWEELEYIYLSLLGQLFNSAYSSAWFMQKAYNCEFNEDQELIKTNYPSAFSDNIKSGDFLLSDIKQFNAFGTSLKNNFNRDLQQTISLASNYPYLFEEVLKRNGQMEFQTRMEDFDLNYPGTYLRKVQNVDVIVEGLLPNQDVKCYLTNNGISLQRTNMYHDISLRFRPKETHIFNNYRQSKEFSTNLLPSPKSSAFEGADLCSYWRIELPRLANGLDFYQITDIKLIFNFNCYYDEKLALEVRDHLTENPFLNSGQKLLPLRNLFPENYYSFLKNGNFKFNIVDDMFPGNQHGFKIDNIGLIARGASDKLPYGDGQKQMPAELNTRIISLKTPSLKDGITRKISLNTTNLADKDNPWNNLLGGDALGEYEIKVNSSDRSRFENIEDFVLILEYSYKARS